MTYQLLVSFGFGALLTQSAAIQEDGAAWIPAVWRTSSSSITHVVFTTYKCGVFDCPAARRVAERNSQLQWRRIVTQTAAQSGDNNNSNPVAFVDLTHAGSKIRYNKYGVPILSSMFQRAQKLYPQAQTFTYVNADILPPIDFFETANVALKNNMQPFLLVGKRCNVDWKANNPQYDVQNANFSFDALYQQGQLFIGLAQDYFIFSRTAVDWKSIPPFVIGRVAYDNWLVDYSFHHPNINLIDATKTIRIIHQTDEDGNMAQGGKLHQDDPEDRFYNNKLGNGQWDHGNMNDAHWESYFPTAEKNNSTAVPRLRARRDWTVVVSLSRTNWDFFDSWWRLWPRFCGERIFRLKKLVLTCQDEESFLEYQTRALPPYAHLRMAANARTDVPSILLHELQFESNVLYNDLSVVWLSNPLVHLQEDDIDVWCAASSATEQPHTCRPGFWAFCNSTATMSLLREWAADAVSPQGAAAHKLPPLQPVATARTRVLPSENFKDGARIWFDNKQKETALVAYNNHVEGEDWDETMSRFVAHGLWSASQHVTAQRQRNEGKVPHVSFKIIILVCDHMEKINNLLSILEKSDYLSDRVDLEVRFDRPADASPQWEQAVEEIRRNIKDNWKQGSTNVIVSEKHMGTREVWLEAWHPVSNAERAILLRADSQVPLLWYRWLHGAHKAYGDRPDFAGIALQGINNTSLVSNPQDRGQPFLYQQWSSAIYSPRASVWNDFLDFVKCAMAKNLTMEMPNNSIQYHAADSTTSLGSFFLYFLSYRGLATVFSPPADVVTAQASNDVFAYPVDLVTVDDKIQPLPSEPILRGLVMSAAIGYPRMFYVRFVKKLREHYRRDISLLIAESTPADVKEFLTNHSVNVVETAEEGGPRESPGWHRVNKIRYQFYQDACRESKYDLCMTTDFRDILFQDDPFINMTIPVRPTLHVYLHNIPVNGWALEGAMKCKGENEAIRDKTMINAGGLIASPSVFSRLAWINTEYGATCDDQIALNLAVYSNVMQDVEVVLHEQGEGSVNNVAYNGKFTRDSRERFLNHNCFPAPAAHQFDLL